MPDFAIEMLNITKVFPGIIANDKVTLQVRRGEIHALLGENGAGKSTLMSILFGLYDPDGGSIRLGGQTVTIKNPNDAFDHGIGMVHQHFKLVHNYTVTENIVLGQIPRGRAGNVDLRQAEKRVAELSAQYSLHVDPKARIDAISVGQQQRVEILTPQEIDELMVTFGRLKAEGKTLILITHKLKEITEVADRCTVLRRGKVVGTVNVADTSETALAEMMVGRPVLFALEKAPAKPGKVVLSLQGLTVKGDKGNNAVNNLNLEVHAGEIVGIAGVDGNGQSELLEAITGLVEPSAGKILLGGRDMTRASIRERIRQGVGHVPEDRHRHGLVLDFRLDENLILKTFDRPPFSNRWGLLNDKPRVAHAGTMIEQFDIRAGQGAATKARSMSGGNQQKAIILDVGAIEYIHKRLVEERDKGRAVLLVSFELDEILQLCDRIAALSKGEIVGIVPATGADVNHIGAMMAGVRHA